MLLKRAGEIALAPVRRHIQGQCWSARLRPERLPIDTTPPALPLSALGGIEIHSVRRTADEPLFRSLMEQYHYPGCQQPVGEHLKYLVWARGALCARPVAALEWPSSPAIRARGTAGCPMGPAGAGRRGSGTFLRSPTRAFRFRRRVAGQVYFRAPSRLL
ncbi:MAG: hypothetical protein ACLQU1_19720 [Bryobacteraceae bacterium]